MANQGAYVTWIAQLYPPQGEWSEEDYFALPEVNRIIELSDGEILLSPPPTPKHQLIVGNLEFSLTGFVRANRLGVVMSSPIAVRLWEGKIRGPDVLFLRNEHLGRIGGKAIEGAPDWVAEVISPRSRKTDSVTKVAEYAQAGIPEYWLLDGKAKTIRVYKLEGAAYVLVATYGTGQTAQSATLPGFEVSVDQVFGA